MVDATAAPGTLMAQAAAQQASAPQTATPEAVDLGLSVEVPGVSTDDGTNSTINPATFPAQTTLLEPTISTIETVDSSRITFSCRGTLSVTSRPLGYGKYASDDRGPEYDVIVLSPGGTQLASLENAILGEMTWVLNGAGSASFQLPTEDPKSEFLKTAETEIQIWRGPDLMWWGVIVRAQGDERAVTYQCVDLSWYFTRRVIGAAEVNYINNGSFEANFWQWEPATYAPTEPGGGRNTAYWRQEIRTVVPQTGATPISGSKMLYQWSDLTSRIFFGIKMGQSFEWTPNVSESPEGDTWSVVAWCYIPSAEWYSARVTPYTWEGQTAPTGISLVRLYKNRTRTHFVPGVGWRTDLEDIELIRLPVDASTPQDQWVRLEAPLEQPVVAGQEEIILLLLETPVGAIYWDEISLVRNERLYFNNVDQAQIMKGLVEHAQNPAVGGKSDLRIGTNVRNTGIKRERIYEYYNHELISDSIDEFPGLWEGADWSIEITPDTRTFTTHFPRKGTTKPKYALVLGKNVSRVTVKVDGEETSNSVIVVADQGDGAAREEGVARDTSTLQDGLVLEKVYTATPGSTINTLTAQALRGVRRYKDPVIIPTISVFQQDTDEILGMIQVGDVVPVDIRYGWFQLNDEYRITQISLNPQTEEMAITVNPEVNWSLDEFAP